MYQLYNLNSPMRRINPNMIFLTIDYRDEDDTWSEQTITRKFSDDVSDETLQEAVVEMKNKVTE